MQSQVQKFTSTCGKAVVFVENEMPIGEFHDFLMFLKGTMIERMVKIHKDEVEMTEEMKKNESE